MNQRTKTLVTLLVLVAAVGGMGWYVYATQKGDEQRAEQSEHDLRLFAPQKLDEKNLDGGAAMAEFTKLTVTASGSTTVLERAPKGTWRITAPVSAAVDKLAIDQLVSHMQTARFKEAVDEKPDAAALKKYGLAEPQFVVEATAEVGAARAVRTTKLIGGIENTFDGSIFMQRNDSPVVYAAEGGVKWALQKSTFDLRAKELLDAEEAAIRQITVDTKLNHYVLTHSDNKTWRIANTAKSSGPPAKTPAEPALADAVTVAGLISSFRNERASAFLVDSPQARATYGLEKPEQTISFVIDGREKPVTVRLNRASPDAGSAGTMLREGADETVLAEIAPSAFGAFDRNPADLLDKGVVQFDKNAVTKAVFRLADGTDVVAEREPADAGTADTWRLVSPVAGPAKVFKLASLLWAVGSVKTGKVVDEKPKNLAKYGLGDNARSVTLFGPERVHPLARLVIGDDVPNAPDRKYFFGSAEKVVEADASKLADYPKNAAELLDAAPIGDAGP